MVTKTCHNVTCFFNWNIFKSLKALYLLFSLHRLKWTPFPILKYHNDCCKIWSKMLPPERLHSTMNQKSARTLLTCLNVWVSRADCRLVLVGGGGPCRGPDHTHNLPPPTYVKFRGHSWCSGNTFQLRNTTTTSIHYLAPAVSLSLQRFP